MFTFDQLLLALGKGPGFLALAFVEVGLAALLVYNGFVLDSFVLALGAINVPVYGSGAAKAWSDNAAKRRTEEVEKA